MKTAVVLFTLFFQAAADPDPTPCCRPREFAIYYNETAENDSNYSKTDLYLGVDYNRKLVVTQDGPGQNINIVKLKENKMYTVTPQDNCTWKPLPPSFSSMFPYDSTCLPSDAVFVRYYPMRRSTFLTWNFTYDNETCITSTVIPSTCLPYEERVVKPPTEDPPFILQRRTSMIKLYINGYMKFIPRVCPEDRSNIS